jgi:hypothetical protein
MHYIYLTFTQDYDQKNLQTCSGPESRSERIPTVRTDVSCVYKAKVYILFHKFMLTNRVWELWVRLINRSRVCYTTNETINEITVLINGTALPRLMGKLPPDVVDGFIVESLYEPTNVWSLSSPSTRTSAIPLCTHT